MLKPDVYLNFGKIISLIEQSNFTISNLKMFKMGNSDASQFYA